MGSADSRCRHAAGVGPHSTHVCGAREARVMGCPREGVNRAGTGAARHDRSGKSFVEKPRSDDSLADGSPRDRATGRFRARVETRPADLGRVGPDPDRQSAGVPLWREAPPSTALAPSARGVFDATLSSGDARLTEGAAPSVHRAEDVTVLSTPACVYSPVV